MYHSSKAARDRDRLREQVLNGLGWRLYRIWGTDWYRGRAGAELRLKEAVEQAIAQGPLTAAPVQSPGARRHGPRTVSGRLITRRFRGIVRYHHPRWPGCCPCAGTGHGAGRGHVRKGAGRHDAAP